MEPRVKIPTLSFFPAKNIAFLLGFEMHLCFHFKLLIKSNHDDKNFPPFIPCSYLPPFL